MRGFTLFELVLVLALLGVLSLIAIPRFASSPAGLDAAAHKIRNDIRYAQSLAMSKGVTHGVDFVMGAPYAVYQTDVSSPITDPETRQPFSEDLVRFRNVSVSNSYRVEYDALGRPTLGGGGSVIVTDGSLIRTIQVAPNTGRVTIAP